MSSGRTRKKITSLLVLAWLCFTIFIPQIKAKETGENNIQVENGLLPLSEEEQQYISDHPLIKVYVVDGMAPIQYQNEKGELQGITKKIFHNIEKKTGFVFEYIFIDNIHSALKDRQAEIMAAIPFTFEDSEFYEDVQLSPEYLSTNQILILHEGEEATNLKSKIYGAVQGSPIPSSVDRRTTVFFDTREDILDAVDKGEVDFSYINAYSASYYLLQNSYDHIVSIPSFIQNTELTFGYLDKQDTILPGILNAALESIDADMIQNYIVEEATKIDRKISLQLVLNSFYLEISVIATIVTVGLSYLTLRSRRDKRKFQMQNNRLLALSELSDEYFYEYDVMKEKMLIADDLRVLLDTYQYGDALKTLEANLIKVANEYEPKNKNNENLSHSSRNIILTDDAQKRGTYKMINLMITDEQENILTIIGKLVDVSSFEQEKEQLKTQAERDGLTRLYNFESSKKLIKNKLLVMDSDALSAFIMVDIDYFKKVNDTLGHQEGNRILKKCSNLLRDSFEEEDIKARVGGDEFCVFVDTLSEQEIIKKKCLSLSKNMQETVQGVPITLSIGIAFIREEDNYQTAFKHADEALYLAKEAGRARIAIYGEDSIFSHSS